MQILEDLERFQLQGSERLKTHDVCTDQCVQNDREAIGRRRASDTTSRLVLFPTSELLRIQAYRDLPSLKINTKMNTAF